MSQPPSNHVPQGLSFQRRAPVRIPPMEYPRLGGPVESQPPRAGELTATPTAAIPPTQQAFPTETPYAAIPPAQQGFPTETPYVAIPTSQQAFPTAPIHLGDTTPQVARLLATPPVELDVAAPMTTPAPLTSPVNLAPFQLGPTTPAKEESTRMISSTGNQMAIPDARDHAKVIVYGRSGSTACMRAIQDLMERQISFQYVDVSRDSDAAAHLAAICNGEPVVPVIVHLGFNA